MRGDTFYYDPVIAQLEDILDAVFGDGEEPPPLDLDPEPGWVGANIPEPVPITTWNTTLTPIIEELSRGVHGDVQPNTGFTSYSISRILDLIAVSRDPGWRSKGTNWTVGGYPMTVGGYTQWRDDVNLLLEYVAGKREDRYDSFLGGIGGRSGYSDEDPSGFNALIGAYYHTPEEQLEDIRVLIDVWPPWFDEDDPVDDYGKKPVMPHLEHEQPKQDTPDPVDEDDPVDEEPEIFMPDLEHEQPVPWPETFMPDLEHEQPVPWETEEPPPTTTTTTQPPTTTLPPTTTTFPPPTTRTTVQPPTTITFPPPTTTILPPTTTTTVPADDGRGGHKKPVEGPLPTQPPGYPPWVRPMGPEARPHTPHGPFWPRRPADWPYGPGPKYGEIPEGDSTLNVGPDDWGAPPGTPAVFVERLPEEPQPPPPYHDSPRIEEIYGYGGDPRYPGVQMQPASDVYQLIGGELAELYPGGYRVNTGLRPIGGFMGGRRR